MATITEGSTIQASWFQDRDSDGTMTKITLQNNTTDFTISKNSVNLAILKKDASTPGKLLLKDVVDAPSEDI